MSTLRLHGVRSHLSLVPTLRGSSCEGPENCERAENGAEPGRCTHGCAGRRWHPCECWSSKTRSGWAGRCSERSEERRVGKEGRSRRAEDEGEEREEGGD